MRNFIKIVENQLSEMMLYRGDGNHIETFEFDKTDTGALFGPGLYLTTDPIVAADYTANREDEKLYPRNGRDPESRNVKDLMKNYIYSLSNEAFDETSFRNAWMDKNKIPPEGGMHSKQWDVLRSEMEEARKKHVHNSTQKNIDNVRKDLPNLRAFKLTTGELRLVREKRNAVISSFNIPDEYIAKTLNGDAPLSDESLVVVKNLFDEAHQHGNMDLRNLNNDRIKDFDTFIQIFKTRGTRRAWADDEDRKIGGKGQNPSLDDLMNGTHAGYNVFRDSFMDDNKPKSLRMISAFKALGYVGFEYHGGKRLGSYVRGGGGRQHRAFVFWDVPYIQKCRVDHHPLPNVAKITSRSLPLV